MQGIFFNLTNESASTDSFQYAATNVTAANTNQSTVIAPVVTVAAIGETV
jgi:hypothetical protein